MKVRVLLMLFIALPFVGKSQDIKEALAKAITAFAEALADPYLDKTKSLVLINNTDKKIKAAYALYNGECSCFISHGWYYIESYSTTEIDISGANQYAYIYANRQGKLLNDIVSEWQGEIPFCINKDKGFDIRYANDIICEYKPRFSELKLNKGKNKFTFNP